MGGGGPELDLATEPAVPDLVLLSEINEETILDTLKTRYNNDRIYTSIGEVIISVNPYKKLDNLYSPELMNKYRGVQTSYHVPPHIYSIGDRAYSSMRDNATDQCVIITGESGAGKTEASKIFMKYIASVSDEGNKVELLKDQLLDSNPCLEAFGNAKTLRNDNSSRFGKYMDIQFDFTCSPVGGRITTYLLEKSRVTKTEEGERSFHIFYQLLKGADQALLDKLNLTRNPSDYAYLSSSKNDIVPDMDDSAEFKNTVHAMTTLGLSEEKQFILFSGIAAILHLGNLQIEKKADRPECTIVNKNSLKCCAELLGVSSEILERGLMNKMIEEKMRSSKSNILSPLELEKAKNGRDALAKILYARLFDFLVSEINKSLSSHNHELPNAKVRKHRLIGVLDIYGFEVFPRNSFEQFIINYCNERLQQVFIDLVLKTAQEEYEREGIEWVHINYFNNAVICELIESNTGIISMLNEECLRPGPTSDVTFLDKLNTTNVAKNIHYESRGKNKNDKTLDFNVFKLKHYAADVTYSIDGFLEKNSDPVSRLLLYTINDSSIPAFKELFPENPSQEIYRRADTLATQFKSSMNQLVQKLKTKNPHYIRCIKPNTKKAANDFKDEFVRHQVRYLGVQENVRVRRAGYVHLQTYTSFVERYKMLCKETWPHWRGNAIDGTKLILDAMKLRRDEYEFGKTKIFIKDPQTVMRLESERHRHKGGLAIRIQATYKGHRARKEYKKAVNNMVRVQAVWRGIQERRRYLKKRNAAITISKYVRRFLAQKELQRRKLRSPKYAIIALKSVWMRYRARKFIGTVSVAVKKATNEGLTIQWPVVPPGRYMKTLSDTLKRVYQRALVARYKYVQKTSAAFQYLEWKVVAHTLFKGKKTTYDKSINKKFVGTHVNVLQDPKWSKVSTETSVSLAVTVEKLHRHDLGLGATRLLVVTGSALYGLDPKTYGLKEYTTIDNITGFSCSPFKDGLFVVHCKDSKKGDMIFKSDDHIFEILGWLCLALRRKGVQPTVNIADSVTFAVSKTPTRLTFEKTSLPYVKQVVKKGQDWLVHSS